MALILFWRCFMNSAEQIVTHDLLRIVSVPFGEIYT